MSRPPRDDRSAVAARHVGLRLNAYEHETLTRCVAAKNRQMAEMGLPPMMTPTSFLKYLIQEEAKRLFAARKADPEGARGQQPAPATSELDARDDDAADDADATARDTKAIPRRRSAVRRKR